MTIQTLLPLYGEVLAGQRYYQGNFDCIPLQNTPAHAKRRDTKLGTRFHGSDGSTQINYYSTVRITSPCDDYHTSRRIRHVWEGYRGRNSRISSAFADHLDSPEIVDVGILRKRHACCLHWATAFVLSLTLVLHFFLTFFLRRSCVWV